MASGHKDATQPQPYVIGLTVTVAVGILLDSDLYHAVGHDWSASSTVASGHKEQPWPDIWWVSQ